MQIDYIPVEEIKPYENNPRSNDSAVDAVVASIKEYGFKVPIVVDKNNVIITGHTRLKAAQKLKLSMVPVIIASDLSPEQARAYRLADNKTAELAEWDIDMLEAELLELIDFDMSIYGFDNIDFSPENNVDQPRLDKKDIIHTCPNCGTEF